MPETSTPLIVGLTGSIAGGKSTVAEMFRKLGAHLIDFDLLARKVVEPGTPALANIIESFGNQVLQPDGSLDRKKMARIVFRNPDKRRLLERLIHPEIFKAFEKQVDHIISLQPDAIIVAEVPLLVEANLQHRFDKIVLVSASAPVQRRRLLSRPGISEKQADEMLAAQLPLEEKTKAADYIVDNDTSLDATRRQVRSVWEKLTAHRLESGSAVSEIADMKK